MRIWQTIAQSPWPLRIIYFVLAIYLALGLIAAVAWFEFGRAAEDQVVNLAEDLTTVVGIILAPVLLVGLIAVPFYRWITRKLVGFIEDRDRPQA
jgi:DMSO/TMAO reductase YedYZ heme-binding membrane subunit